MANGFTVKPLPMRPCSLCNFFILTGADPESFDAFARCDCPGYEREIFPGSDVLRCCNFAYRTRLAAEKDQGRRVGIGGFGIGAPITTDAKFQNGTTGGVV